MNRHPIFIHRVVRLMADRLRSAISNSLGITLVETVVALAIFSSAGTAVLLGVSAAHISSDRVKASAVAENLARNQMEYVLSLPYVAPPGSYDSVANDLDLDISIPSNYTVGAIAQSYVEDELPGSIQKVVVTVRRDGQIILVLESLRSGP